MRLLIGKATDFVTVCCKLHNFVIDHGHNMDVPGYSGVDDQSESEPRDRNVYPQHTCDSHIT